MFTAKEIEELGLNRNNKSKKNDYSIISKIYGVYYLPAFLKDKLFGKKVKNENKVR